MASKQFSMREKELCSAIYQVMGTCFNAVASDPPDKCDNWHYFRQCAVFAFCCFSMYHPNQEAAVIRQVLIMFHCHLPTVSVTLQTMLQTLTCSVCVRCWHDCIPICGLQTSVLVRSVNAAYIVCFFTTGCWGGVKTLRDTRMPVTTSHFTATLHCRLGI